MQIVNNLFKWSFYISGLTLLMLMAGIVSIWLIIEILAVMASMTT